MCILALFIASALAGKDKPEKVEKKTVEDKKTDGKTGKRGIEEISYVPEEQHAYAEGYGHGGYELGGQASLGLLGYGGHSLHPTTRIKSIIINKEVTVPVPHPYPVPVERQIPYPVHIKVPVPVVRHYPVPVPKPYPVAVEKKVPYPVEKIVPYPVKVPVKIPYAVPHPVPVEQPYPVPVHVPHPVPVPQPVIVKNPVPVYHNEGFEGFGFGESFSLGSEYHH